MPGTIRLWSFADVDRSGKVRWTAAELGYEIEERRLELGEHKGGEYAAMNPYNQVPTAEIDGQTWIESTAICILLAQRHPEVGLIPRSGETAATFWQSVAVSTTTLEIPVVNYFLSQRGIMDETWGPLLKPVLDTRLNAFATSLPHKGYICGEFSLADIFAAYVLRVGVQGGLLPRDGILKDYFERLMERPAARESRMLDSLQG